MKFSQSRIDFKYKGANYHLDVNVRVAIDLERHIGEHPLNLAQEIFQSQTKGKIPPLGQMAKAFEFMLMRAGVQYVDLDEIYGDIFDVDKTVEMSKTIGTLLALFVPQMDEEEVKKKPVKRKSQPKK